MTPFTKRVYQAVLGIPLGQVRSYKWIAHRAGSPGAHRAVGQIMKNNPFPLIIPCHRVVKANGQIGGYSGRGGKQAKKILLETERQISELILVTKQGKK